MDLHPMLALAESNHLPQEYFSARYENSAFSSQGYRLLEKPFAPNLKKKYLSPYEFVPIFPAMRLQYL